MMCGYSFEQRWNARWIAVLPAFQPLPKNDASPKSEIEYRLSGWTCSTFVSGPIASGPRLSIISVKACRFLTHALCGCFLSNASSTCNACLYCLAD